MIIQDAHQPEVYITEHVCGKCGRVIEVPAMARQEVKLGQWRVSVETVVEYRAPPKCECGNHDPTKFELLDTRVVYAGPRQALNMWLNQRSAVKRHV